MIKSLFLKTGELVLERPLDVAEMLERKPRLKKLHAMLEGKFKKAGLKDLDATAAATKELEHFLSSALGRLGDAFVEGKRTLLIKLVKLQGDIRALYLEVMHGRGEIKLDLDGLRGRYQEMQSVFDELGKSVEEVAASTKKKAAAEPPVKPIDLPATSTGGKKPVGADVRFATLKDRPNFKGSVDAITHEEVFIATQDGGKTKVEFRVKDGKFNVRSFEGNKPMKEFNEYDVLGKYKDAPPSTKVIQAHHGCQSAAMTELFGDVYNPNEAPTIWLRDSTGESPHGLITHSIQNPQKAARVADIDLTFGKIRDWAVGDLKAAGAPDTAIREYLTAVDQYFKAEIEPKLSATQKAELIGTIKKY